MGPSAAHLKLTRDGVCEQRRREGGELLAVSQGELLARQCARQSGIPRVPRAQPAQIEATLDPEP